MGGRVGGNEMEGNGGKGARGILSCHSSGDELISQPPRQQHHKFAGAGRARGRRRRGFYEVKATRPRTQQRLLPPMWII
jgi:hypothetical protein